MTRLFLKLFLGQQLGQDLIEYTLLMAFVALAAAALFIGSGAARFKTVMVEQPCQAGQQSTTDHPCRSLEK